MTGTREMTLLHAEEPPALAPPPESVVGMFARLAADPNVDPDKLQRLMDMQERILRLNAEAAFNTAFAQMQAEVPTIAERGKTDKTTYATLEDIIQAVRPVLHKHGFALSHETDWPSDKQVKVIGILTHKDGHSRRSVFLSAADNTGSKNAIQALGSTMSYGRRYTAMDLLNITTRFMDDDGQKSGSAEPPDGYQTFVDALDDVAVEGIERLDEVWAKSSRELQQFGAAHDTKRIAAIRKKAREASKGAKK